MTKSFSIEKKAIWYAYQRVRANGGAAGVDEQRIEEFEIDLKNNLYKIWNRMNSGSYMPPPVLRVAIPKKTGGERSLGIPTVSDRIAQMVVKKHLDDILEPIFHEDSYGYRLGKLAHQAINKTKKRCWKYKWILEFDIKGLFDNVSHKLLMKAVRHHVKDSWVILYIERWLKAPMYDSRVGLIERHSGTPQGGVVSPVLANLFLHYVFDMWMQRNFPHLPFCRYSDDGLVHVNDRSEAEILMRALEARFKECGLEMHPDKTKIVYCGTDKKDSELRSFDFLGFTFRRRGAKGRGGKIFTGFLPAISKVARKAISIDIRSWRLHRKSDKNIWDLARMFNNKIRGWKNYYGKFYSSAMYSIWKQINQYLVRWAIWKFKKFRRHKTRALKWMKTIALRSKGLLAHWDSSTCFY